MSDDHPTWYSRCLVCGAKFVHRAGHAPDGCCDMDRHKRLEDFEDRRKADPLGLTLEAYRALRAKGKVV